MNLQKVYESLKREYQSRGVEVEDGKLRQLAWIKRDRMMYESSLNISSAASSAAGAGSGGGKRILVDLTGVLITENNLPIITESGINLGIE
jgi:hypothetical protein